MSVAAHRLNHKRVYYMGVIHGPVFNVIGSQGVQAHGHLGPLVVSRNVDSVKTHIGPTTVEFDMQLCVRINTQHAQIKLDFTKIFIDAVDPLWGEIGQWAESEGHVQVSVVDAVDAARGQVIDGRFTQDGPNGLFFIQTPPGTVHDLSAFANGYLVFDIQVLDYGNANGLVVKADCVNPCSSGDIPIGKVADGEWQTVVVSVADSMAGLDLQRVDTPFAIMPSWGEQTGGIHLQVDNVRWVLNDPRI